MNLFRIASVKTTYSNRPAGNCNRNVKILIIPTNYHVTGYAYRSMFARPENWDEIAIDRGKIRFYFIKGIWK